LVIKTLDMDADLDSDSLEMLDPDSSGFYESGSTTLRFTSYFNGWLVCEILL
jgi:hypothetical protein